MKQLIPERILHRLFEITLVIKAIDGVLEFIGGLLFALVKPTTLDAVVAFLTQHELDEDPNDFFFSWLIQYIVHLPHGTKVLGVFYLIVHGFLKIFMSIALWRDKLWAYPTMITILSAFICYQLYRFTHTHSWWLIFFSLFDLIIILLTRHEYWYHHARLQRKKQLAAS